MNAIQIQDIIAASDRLQKQQGTPGEILAKSWESLRRIYSSPNGTDTASQNHNGFVTQFQLLELSDNTDSMKTINSALPDQPGKLLESIPEDGNIYLMRNVCRKKYGNGKKNVLEISSVIVDLDAHKIDVTEANAIGRVCAYTLQQEVNAGMFHGMEPMSIHFTGRGVQIIWRIQALQSDGASEARHDRLACLLCRFTEEWLNCHGPLSILDTDRPVAKNMGGLIRMPGSFNQAAATAVGREKAQSVPYNPTARRIHTIDELEQAVCNALHTTLEDFVCTESVAEEKTGKSAGGDSRKSGKTVRKKSGESTWEPLPLDEKPSDIYAFRLPYEEQLKILKTRMSLYEREKRYYAVFNMLSKKYPKGKGIPVGMRDRVIYVLGNLMLQFESIRETKARLCGISRTMFRQPFTENEIESCMSTSFHLKHDDETRGYILSNSYICETLGLNVKNFPRIIDFKKRNKITRLNQLIKKDRLDKAHALRASGMTISEVAKEMNVSERTISRWMKPNGTDNNTTKTAPKHTVQTAPAETSGAESAADSWGPVISLEEARAYRIVGTAIQIRKGERRRNALTEEEHKLLQQADNILRSLTIPQYRKYMQAGCGSDDDVKRMILTEILSKQKSLSSALDGDIENIFMWAGIHPESEPGFVCEDETDNNTMQIPSWKPVITWVKNKAQNIVQMGIDIWYGKKQREDFAEEDHELLRRTDKILYKVRSPLYDEYVRAGTRSDEDIRRMILIDLLYPAYPDNTQPTIETSMKPVIIPAEAKARKIIEMGLQIRRGEQPDDALTTEEHELLQRANDIFCSLTTSQYKEYMQTGYESDSDVKRMILIDLLYPVYANPQASDVIDSDDARSTVQTTPAETTGVESTGDKVQDTERRMKDNEPDLVQPNKKENRFSQLLQTPLPDFLQMTAEQSMERVISYAMEFEKFAHGRPVRASLKQSQAPDVIDSDDTPSTATEQTVPAIVTPVPLMQTLSKEELARLRLEAIQENEEESLSYIVPEHVWTQPEDDREDDCWAYEEENELFSLEAEQEEAVSHEHCPACDTAAHTETRQTSDSPANDKPADTEISIQDNMAKSPEKPAVSSADTPPHTDGQKQGDNYIMLQNETNANRRIGKISVAFHPLLALICMRNPKQDSALCKSAGTICAEKPPQRVFIKSVS